MSIRIKVLLLSGVLLAIPYVGYQYVREMESYLRDGLESALLGAAQALAGALHDRPDLLGPRLMDAPPEQAGLYVHPLRHAIEIDGYTGDWEDYLARLEPLGGAPPDAAFSARYLAGKHGQYLYLLFLVKDRKVVYAPPPGADPAHSDHLRLSMSDAAGRLHTYRLSTPSPGWVTAYQTANTPRIDTVLRIEGRIRAEWQPTRDGYTLEVRIPVSMTGARIGFEVANTDRTGTPPHTRLASSPRHGRRYPLLELLLPSAAIEGLIKSLGRTPGRRIWVLDRHRRVVARGGSLAKRAPERPINPLLALILRPPNAELFEQPPVVSRLAGPEIEAALAGRPERRWRGTTAPGTYVISAAHPIWLDETIAGAVVVEETSLGIQTVRRQALANLFNKTLLVCVVGGLTLLFFANRISGRLSRLRAETDRAIDPQGRVIGTVSGTRAGDEIGAVAHSFAGMIERLRQYNTYLEQLARRLSHELRTPIAVVRSSLETLALSSAENAHQPYIERAREGLTRLDSIITRMSEASRLEQAIHSAQPTAYDLDRIVAAAVDAYRSTWPDTTFEFTPPDTACPVYGLPDLGVQMLDKLVANAREFRTADSPVRLQVARRGARVQLQIMNHGSALPPDMSNTLFDSMVSVRDARGDGEPHLGLGLYIVRLIAEFHGGNAGAENLDTGDGVRMWVDLPAATAKILARRSG